MTITSTSRTPSETTTRRAADAPHAPPEEAGAKSVRPPSLSRFAAALGPRPLPPPASPSATPTPSTRDGSPTTPRLGARAREEPERPVSRPIRPSRGPGVIERDPTELLPFRPLPAVLAPPTPPTSPIATTARIDLARAAEQLVTRLRVGRAKEGAIVELRLALGGRELDLRLVETARGIELHADDADESLRRALAHELSARGLAITIE